MMRIKYKILSIIFLLSVFVPLMAQQINLNRIEQMPNHPVPYLMRDWKNVALGYDSLVFNSQLSGSYLPLISFYSNTVNYPSHSSFRLHSYVGTKSPLSSEAINVLPAIIGATLSGVDKSNQHGNNYVLMGEEFFNKRPEENVYLNQPVSSSGNDWWYETMPNIFFYQLYDLYPGTGDFEFQFTTVADRWLEAVIAMGGSTSPWTIPNMNYRAWKLSNMTPLIGGVIEPEAAGAISWILYNAFLETGLEKYRIGAELCLEFLLSLSTNPSYEIQLPYGVLTAARMNAEAGTNFNIEKLINWCFNNYVHRNWGTIVGKWGGYDVNGLIGETYNNDNNDYAFLMNTFQQAGALVPLVRYDERFARAIGKWMLNAANSSRLFYSIYLPGDYQDNRLWSQQYDPYSYIAYESLKEVRNGKSPYATGDALSGGWASTNLALYASSHVGIFGGIIDVTNVEQILKLDLRKTDYFNHSGYPTYLFFNPYNEVKTVQLNTGTGIYDLYDLISNTFIVRNITGITAIDIPADAAIIITITPAGGTVSYELDKLLINGIIVDYNSGQTFNNPPRIKSLAPEKSLITLQDSVKIYCTAEDKDKDILDYSWSSTGGNFTGSGPSITYYSPANNGDFLIICTVSDGKGSSVSDTIIITVVDKINNSPKINYLNAKPGKLDINSSALITCDATDPDGDILIYHWNSISGSFSGSGNNITWHSPSAPGNYFITCRVSDGLTEVADSILLIVRDFSQNQSGNLLLYLPYNGNAIDESGNGNNILVYQASLVPDRFSVPDRAFFFDGADDHMLITNTPALNFQNSITVNFWIKVSSFFQRESYPISHGNWENRWKISITNKKIRWTIKTTNGIVDLDSKTELQSDSLYNISAMFNGSDIELFINGELDAYKMWGGTINQTNYDLVIGQSLPGNYNYGFRGILDEIRIFDYAISMDDIISFYDLTSDINDRIDNLPDNFLLAQNYPNPFNFATVIELSIPSLSNVTIKVYDILGNEIANLVNKELAPGNYRLNFDTDKLSLSSGVYFYKLISDSYSETKKMILIR
jgi:hypothetical protein